MQQNPPVLVTYRPEVASAFFAENPGTYTLEVSSEMVRWLLDQLPAVTRLGEPVDLLELIVVGRVISLAFKLSQRTPSWRRRFGRWIAG